MPKARANGIELEWDRFGNDADPALLLIMGLGAQMTIWDEGFCERLASRGFNVIRFDNRDVGHSTWMTEAGLPNVFEVARRQIVGEPVEVPYTLHDMADDAAGLLDDLDIEAAHCIGASMGGMIAQELTLRHPARVKSLTSIMSTTGHPDLPPATPEAMAVLTTPVPREREAAIEHNVRNARAVSSPGFEFDEVRIRERAERNYDRAFHPEGTARQLAAILATPHRRDALADVGVPSLVIHGDADPLVHVECGRDTHRAIPTAEWLEIPGMGHDLPPAVWGRVIEGASSITSR